jgi:hypothetical protein
VDFDYPGFVHTVLVDTRTRLARSDRPDRVFETVLQVARRRVLNSTPLYYAVATVDTVTLVRSAMRGLLRVVDAGLDADSVVGPRRAGLADHAETVRGV